MVGAVESATLASSLAFRSLAELFQLPFRGVRGTVQRLGRDSDVSASRVERLLDAVLQLPRLERAIARALADADQFRRFFAIAAGQFERFLRIVSLDFR